MGVYKEDAFRHPQGQGQAEPLERARVVALAQRREIDAVLVTELTRWGRSTKISCQRSGSFLRRGTRP